MSNSTTPSTQMKPAVPNAPPSPFVLGVLAEVLGAVGQVRAAAAVLPDEVLRVHGWVGSRQEFIWAAEAVATQHVEASLQRAPVTRRDAVTTGDHASDLTGDHPRDSWPGGVDVMEALESPVAKAALVQCCLVRADLPFATGRLVSEVLSVSSLVPHRTPHRRAPAGVRVIRGAVTAGFLDEDQAPRGWHARGTPPLVFRVSRMGEVQVAGLDPAICQALDAVVSNALRNPTTDLRDEVAKIRRSRGPHHATNHHNASNGANGTAESLGGLLSGGVEPA